MSSGRLDSRRLRFDASHSDQSYQPSFSTLAASQDAETGTDVGLSAAIRRTRDYLLAQQHEEGYWVGELEGDTILESEYILLLTFLGREKSEQARQAANYILKQQMPEGGWATYPGGPLEISASVKSYFALKVAGHSPEADYMVRARQAILQAGGAERVNSFSRFYLALLGVISYDQCPAVPPELTLIPHWFPLNIYEMSSWSRTIVVPLSLLWAYRPQRRLPEDLGIRELFVKSPEELPLTMGPSETLEELSRPTWINWDRFFQGVDRTLKFLDRNRIRPLRSLAIRRASEWMQQRFAESDGLGAIFPPIVWSVIALKCLGHNDDSPDVRRALNELEKLIIREGDTIRLQPCKSPVWDTALTTLSLREAGVPAKHPSIRRAVQWLLSKEVRQKGDWAVRQRNQEPGGWFFEFNNQFYPDVDDTSMVVMALAKTLPTENWKTDFLLEEKKGSFDNQNNWAVLFGQTDSPEQAHAEIQTLQPILGAIQRGIGWLMALQSRNGGWGAFDADNDREVFTRVPFADHNAMIDPSTADITARVLEMFASLNAPIDHPDLQRAIQYVWNEQESDHCWYGRWGVNYLYGTWQVLVGMKAIGIPRDDPRLQKAAEWIKSKQQDCGGWGETPESYDEPSLRGQGPPTPSQTAWALMGLLAVGEEDSEAVRRGVDYLLETQREDGTWQEDQFTGTGFPRVFYLKYHMYRNYFPLMALARFARLQSRKPASA